MTFRSFAAPVAVAALVTGLWGCSWKSAPTQPTGQDLLTAGNAALSQKDYDKACEELSKAGGGAESQYQAGVACGRAGQAKAERAFKAALAADPKYAAAMEGLGLKAFADGDLGTAREMLEAGARAGGKDPQAALTLGQTYLLAGMCQPAVAAFQEALRRDPSLVAARARLDAAKILCGAGKASVAAPTHHSVSAPSGNAASTPSAAPNIPSREKESPKAKTPTKTIDLNDI